MRYETRVGKIKCDITTFWILSKSCFFATKLYNEARWTAQKTWDETGKIPSGFDLQKILQNSRYHTYLPSASSAHTAHQVGLAFRSWFRLRKKDKTSRPPGYRKKNSLSSVLFKEGAFKKITEDCILITIGKMLKAEINYQNKRLPLYVIWGTSLPKDGKIQQLEILPQDGFFSVHAKIKLPEPKWRKQGIIVAVDLGQRVPIASVDEKGISDIFKGGEILSNIRYWNKEKARVQSEVMRRSNNTRQWSRSLNKMNKKRNGQINQAIHALSSQFTHLCECRGIKEVILGDLKGIKKEENGEGKNWNSKANQNWQQFPIRILVQQLRYKLARYGIRLIEIDERGTSKGRCSLCGATENISRVHRGMFYCKNCERQQHADINGARNILHKYLHQIGKPITGSSGPLADPMVWRWNNHTWNNDCMNKPSCQ